MLGQLNLTMDFTNPDNFQPNPEIVINGNGAQLKAVNNILPDWLSGALFNASLNLNWGGGVLTGTPNGAVITNGKLDLTGGNKSIDYQAIGNANSQQTGAVKFMFTPNYSGNPSALMALFSIFQAQGSAVNDIMLYHNTDGYFHIYIGDQGGNQLFDDPVGPWNPVNGTEYEIELDYDLTNGKTSLFINGVQLGSSITTTGVRSNSIGVLRLGGNFNGTGFCNGYLRNLLITNDVQHTANYTPGYTLPAQAESYPEDMPVILPLGNANQLPTTGLLTINQSSQIPLNTDIRIVIIRSSGNYWYNGTAWAVSTGASESNSIADGLFTPAILEALNLTDGEYINIGVYLVSTDGMATPTLMAIYLTAQQYLPNTDNLSTNTIYGYILDASGNPIGGVTVSAVLPDMEPYGQESLIIQNPISTTSNAAGYWELNLLPAAEKYTFTFMSGTIIKTFQKTVPAGNSAAFDI